MVALNEGKVDGRKVDGAICPGCDEHCCYPNVRVIDDKYGRQLREVSGWCIGCDVGYIVRQFLNDDGKWLTYEYRKYIHNMNGGPKMSPVGPWVKGYSLPDPAPVVTEPGGDYVKQVELDEGLNKALRTALDVFNKTGKALADLMDIAKKRGEAKNG